MPECNNLIQATEELPVLVGSLGEADARVEDDIALPHPGPRQRGHPRSQLGADLGDDIVIHRARLHVGAVPPPVHDDKRHASRSHHRGHRRVGLSTAHVVDECRPRVEGGAGDRRAHGVDGDDHTGGNEFADDRQHPP